MSAVKTNFFRLLTIFLLQLPFLSHLHATHIVGGDIYLTSISGINTVTGANYTLGLNLYFDLLNGNKGAQDSHVILGIFGKADNRPVEYFQLFLRDTVVLTSPTTSCSALKKKTMILKYYMDIRLDVGTYNNHAGYYITWQRCCRGKYGLC